MVVGIAVIADVEAFVEVEVLPIGAGIVELAAAVDEDVVGKTFCADFVDSVVANAGEARNSRIGGVIASCSGAGKEGVMEINEVRRVIGTGICIRVVLKSDVCSSSSVRVGENIEAGCQGSITRVMGVNLNIIGEGPRSREIRTSV